MGSKIRKNSIFFVVIIFSFLLSVSGSATETENLLNQTSQELTSIPVIDDKINTIKKTLANLLKTPTADLANELGITKDQIESKTDTLMTLQSAYVNLKDAILNYEKAIKEQQSLKRIYEDYRTKGMPQKPPYSLTFHDSIQAEISTLKKNKQYIQLAIEILKKKIEDYKKLLSQKESDLRQFAEKYTRQLDNQISKNILALEIKKLSVEQLKILLQSFDVEKKTYEIKLSNADIYNKQLIEQEAYISSNIHYDTSDLEFQIELIKTKEAEIQDEIKRIESDQEAVEKEWIKAQQEVNTAVAEQERNIAQAYLKARDEWKETYIVVIDLKQNSLRLLERQKNIWQIRYKIVRGDLPLSQKKEIFDEAKKNTDSLNQTLQIQQNFLINLQKEISAIENLSNGKDTPASIIEHLGVEKDALRKQLERRLEFQSMIIATDQIEQNLLSMIEKQLDRLSLKDKLAGLIQIIDKTWNLEIWVVDQNSVSVGKIFTALVILLVGLLLARFFVHFIHKRILAASQFKDTTASAVQKGLSYFAYLMVFLLALRIVNIPLTAFAFLGGAIAIGIGFGAQNLINNFISGFIILGERPIHIGDLIEVDGVLGKVEEIGARCTRVRTGENIHKLIPNSSFLEKNITNWTLSDNRIRTKVIVGVAYGSPIEKVEQMLIRSAKSNKDILTTPEPFVLFSDFGDNSLVFEVYFWVTVRMVLEKKLIESRVRFEIDSQFRQEGIVIAFPQRDLHFDAEKPLNIQLIRQHTEEN